jgi:hypothetical protein
LVDLLLDLRTALLYHAGHVEKIILIEDC